MVPCGISRIYKSCLIKVVADFEFATYDKKYHVWFDKGSCICSYVSDVCTDTGRTCMMTLCQRFMPGIAFSL